MQFDPDKPNYNPYESLNILGIDWESKAVQIYSQSFMQYFSEPEIAPQFTAEAIDTPEYPIQLSTVINGIKLYAIVSKDDAAGYLGEDRVEELLGGEVAYAAASS